METRKSHYHWLIENPKERKKIVLIYFFVKRVQNPWDLALHKLSRSILQLSFWTDLLGPFLGLPGQPRKAQTILVTLGSHS